MPSNPLHRQQAGTLDETIIHPDDPQGKLGWRWLLSCLYLLLLASMVVLVLWPVTVGGRSQLDLINLLVFPEALFVLVPLLSGVLLFFRTQVGWVLAMMVVSAMIVLSALGLTAQFIPRIEPVDYLRGARMLTSSASLLLACGIFYLLSHPALRAGFRVPHSWIRPCISLGGLLGAGLGMWLLYLVGVFTGLR